MRKVLVFWAIFLLVIGGFLYGCGRVVEESNLNPNRPLVTSVFPVDGATRISTTTEVRAVFNKEMDNATISATTITLASAEGKSGYNQVSYNNSLKTVTLGKGNSANLSDNTKYYARISAEVKSADGLSLEVDYVWSFTTGSASPEINYSLPNNSSGVPVNTSFVVYFNKAILASTITSSTISIASPSGQVSGTLTYSEQDLSYYATFIPSSNLSYSTNYTLTITTGIKDAAGNPLKSGLGRSFSTISAPTGESWQNVGSAGFSSGTANYAAFDIDSGVPYIAFADGDYGNKVTVMKYESGSWSVVGSAGFSDGVAVDISLDVYSGVPYVAYSDLGNGNKLVVKKYAGSNWTAIGDSSGISVDTGYKCAIAIDNSGIPYVAYQDGNALGKATVLKYESSSWSIVGSAGISSGVATATDIFLMSNIPYVAYIDGTNDFLVVQRFVDGAWSAVGAASGITSGTTKNISVFAVSTNEVYASGSVGSTNNGTATILKYDGGNWSTISSFATGSYYCPGRRILRVNGGIVYQLIGSTSYSGPSLYKYQSGSWSVVGNESFTSADVSYPGLVFSGSVPYVGYVDGGHNSKVSAMKYQ